MCSHHHAAAISRTTVGNTVAPFHTPSSTLLPEASTLPLSQYGRSTYTHLIQHPRHSTRMLIAGDVKVGQLITSTWPIISKHIAVRILFIVYLWRSKTLARCCCCHLGKGCLCQRLVEVDATGVQLIGVCKCAQCRARRDESHCVVGAVSALKVALVQRSQS